MSAYNMWYSYAVEKTFKQVRFFLLPTLLLRFYLFSSCSKHFRYSFLGYLEIHVSFISCGVENIVKLEFVSQKLWTLIITRFGFKGRVYQNS